MSTIAFPARSFSADTVAAPALRLTRRGKAVVLASALAVLCLLAIVLGSTALAGSGAGDAQDVRMVQVQAGHTLWQIAAEANPHGDIRETVDEIVRLNSLPSASSLQLGSEIAVPVY